MRKTITWTTAGLFVLSLQGPVLAQTQQKAPESMPPALESPAPGVRAQESVSPEKIEPKTQQTNSQQGQKKKTSKKKSQKKKTKKTKKPPVQE